MNYSPKGMYIWDTWYMQKDDVLHMYHLQRTRDFDDPAAMAIHDFIGHAVTRDLISWEEKPPCFGPDKNNPLDDCQPWTGCAVWHEGRGYLYYTMRGLKNNAHQQHIGLAMTEDPDFWTRYENNPVITPDPEIYATAQTPVKGILDCRDLVVVKDPNSKGWYGYFATRQPALTLLETSVIACAYSEDLINWKQLPPAFASGRYACVEVPDVFELDGKWYMTCLTGTIYGNRRVFSDPNLSFGTIYAVSDSPTGPFCELEDNVLLGGKVTSPLSARSFMWEGERYILYTDRERKGRTDSGELQEGTVTTPKLLKTSGDKLVVTYSPRIESKVSRECEIDWVELKEKRLPEAWGQIWAMQSARLTVEDKIRFENPSCWSVLPLSHSLESFILEADVTLYDCKAAGFCIRMADSKKGDFVMLDADSQSIHYSNQQWFDFVEKRNFSIKQNQSYNLKIVNRLEHVEVYVDNVMKLSFSRYHGIGGEVGLFVDRGGAVYENVILRELDI